MKYDTELLVKLQTLLDKFDCLSQTSGIRSAERNKSPMVKGAPNSLHLIGKAVDFVCDNPNQLEKVAREAHSLGFNGIEIDFRDNHIHLDVREHPWKVVFLRDGSKLDLLEWLTSQEV